MRPDVHQMSLLLSGHQIRAAQHRLSLLYSRYILHRDCDDDHSDEEVFNTKKQFPVTNGEIDAFNIIGFNYPNDLTSGFMKDAVQCDSHHEDFSWLNTFSSAQGALCATSSISLNLST